MIEYRDTKAEQAIVHGIIKHLRETFDMTGGAPCKTCGGGNAMFTKDGRIIHIRIYTDLNDNIDGVDIAMPSAKNRWDRPKFVVADPEMYNKIDEYLKSMGVA